MTHPNQIFIFNSSLPDGPGVDDLLRSMGTSSGKIRGQNIGNTYISYGLLKALFGRPVKVAHISNAWEHALPVQLADEINEKYSHFVFILQDFIRESFADLPYDRLTQFLQKIKIPVTPMSLCANSSNGFDLKLTDRLSTEQKKFLATLSEKSKFIGVRGHYSAEILSKLGIKNVKVIGCPSYFENGPMRVVTKNHGMPGKSSQMRLFSTKIYPIPHTYCKMNCISLISFISGEINSNPMPASRRTPTI